MLKTFVTATAIGGLMVSAALAQTTTPPSQTSPAPSATPAPQSSSPASPAPSGTAATSSPNFIAAQKADQWLASKFTGTDVLGPNNEKIGDVNDILFDKSGKVIGIVVGVGGFLGIGEKDVAIDMAAFQMVPATTTANTGSTGTATTGAKTDDPNDMKLKTSWTKDQLKNAPSFERYSAARATGSAPANTGTRPATPAR